MRKLIAVFSLASVVLFGCAQSDSASAEGEEVQKNEAVEAAKERVQKNVDAEQERVDEVDATMDE